MSNKSPCYVIAFGSRKIEFYPLLIAHVREFNEQEAPPETATKAEKSKHAFDQQFQAYLKSAQRGDPNVTMEDIIAVMDTEHSRKCTRAIYSMPPEETPAMGNSVPTSPRIGG